MALGLLDWEGWHVGTVPVPYLFPPIFASPPWEIKQFKYEEWVSCGVVGRTLLVAKSSISGSLATSLGVPCERQVSSAWAHLGFRGHLIPSRPFNPEVVQGGRA